MAARRPGAGLLVAGLGVVVRAAVLVVAGLLLVEDQDDTKPMPATSPAFDRAPPETEPDPHPPVAGVPYDILSAPHPIFTYVSGSMPIAGIRRHM